MKPSLNGMAETFRASLAAPDLIVLPGCYDVLSAMLLQEAGFQQVFFSGYGFAASFMGNPDIGLTSLTETTLGAKNVINAVNVPIIVDVDNGYGNEDNVIRTIYEMESVGAAAIIIEDQIFPKRCGHVGNKKILPLPIYMKKLECALKNRRSPMCIVARTDSMDLDDAIMRANAFHAAGADAVLIDGLGSLEAVKRVGGEVKAHKFINLIHGGKTPLLPVADFGRMGFKVVLYSTPALYLSTRVLRTKLKELRAAGDLNVISQDSCAFREFQDLIEERYFKRVISDRE